MLSNNMKLIIKIQMLLIFMAVWLVQPYQAYTKMTDSCVCCKQTTFRCSLCLKDLFKQSFSSHGINARGNLKQCNDCFPQQKTENIFLLSDPYTKTKKRPALSSSIAILSINEFILSANSTVSIFDQHLLSPPSLIIFTECLRL